MQDINDKINNMHMGKLIHMLSHEMKRNQPIDKVIKADLTIMQKHILKFVLLETMHKDLYQKDIEEEFKSVIGDRIQKHIDVEYVFQDINDVPEEWISDKRKCQRRC